MAADYTGRGCDDDQQGNVAFMTARVVVRLRFSMCARFCAELGVSEVMVVSQETNSDYLILCVSLISVRAF